MAFKPYQKETTINGVKYKAQCNGLSAGLEALDESYVDGTSNISMKKLGKYILEHVIVEPAGLTIDDFEDMDEFREVIQWAQQVMLGKFRDKNKGASEK